MEKRYTVDRASDPRIEEVRDFLCGYQLALDMLNLRQYERRRRRPFDDPCDGEDIMEGDEVLWKARLEEVRALLSALRNGREKLVLYYHYIRGMSIEHAADLIGVSRRTGYRLHQKGLLMTSFLYENMKKNGKIRGLIKGGGV